jgi:hypothetical protein
MFPLPGGSNVVLTAEIKDGEAGSAWLAANPDPSAERLSLISVGDGQYQINLGALEVHEFIVRAGAARQFRAYAELGDGTVLRSIPVQYTVAAKSRSLPSVRVLEQGAYRTVPHFRSHTWLDADALEQIEVHFDGAEPEAVTKIEIGDRSWHLEADQGAEAIVFPVTPEVRAAWVNVKTLVVSVDHACGQGPHNWYLHILLPKLDRAACTDSFTAYQRTCEAIPGSQGALCVRLGDITMGQVMIHVQTMDYRTLTATVSVKERQAVAFSLKDESYVVVVKELVNLLIGQDYAVLAVLPAQEWEQDRIERLLSLVEESDVVFIRHGQEYSGRKAADHLRDKARRIDPPIRTLDEFIDKVASRSWLHHEPYQVKAPDGTIEDAGAWLRRQDIGQLPAAPPPRNHP